MTEPLDLSQFEGHTGDGDWGALRKHALKYFDLADCDYAVLEHSPRLLAIVKAQREALEDALSYCGPDNPDSRCRRARAALALTTEEGE